jgi:hypothetical protein
MTLHLVKLAVGVDDVAAFADWVALRVGEARERGERPVVHHVTRRMPKRAAELLQGGSLFWVVSGAIRVRQRLLGFEAVDVGGKPSCAIVLEGALIPTRAKKHRPFQGWRYLEAKDAPRDLGGLAAMPPEMADELRELGLI